MCRLLRIRRLLGVALTKVTIVCFLVPNAWSHDYWLEQHPVPLAPGQVCSMHLMVGDDLEAEIERPYQKDITSRFDWYVGDQVISLADSQPDSTFPVFRRAVDEQGVSLFVMDRDFVAIESTVGQFLDFLNHEAQPELGAAYAGVDPATPLSRRYARSIKALLQAGDLATGNLHERAVGQRTEIRLLSQPLALELGDDFQVHVAFEGVDLSGQLVRALVRGDDGITVIQTIETNTRGMATFTLERSGLWLIRVAYLRKCEGDCAADWDTHYAVFSFVRL